MKLRHNVPSNPKSAKIDPDYQAEVDRSMERGRLRWESEQTELAKAERRRERLAARLPKIKRASEAREARRKLAEIDAQIESHRQYLQSVQALMTQTGAPSTNRGRKSHRPVPKQGDIL